MPRSVNSVAARNRKKNMKHRTFEKIHKWVSRCGSGGQSRLSPSNYEIQFIAVYDFDVLNALQNASIVMYVMCV